MQDMHSTVSFLSIEAEKRNHDDQFWLIMIKNEWFEEGHPSVSHELRLRCRHCDFGYNSAVMLTVHNLVRMGEEAKQHVETCERSGRSIDLMSSQTHLF